VRIKRWLVRWKLMRAVQLVLYPLLWERQALWVVPAVAKANEIARRSRVDLVYTCCGPYASNFAGLHLSRSLGLPWVTDHRDPWSQSWGLHWPSRAHHRLTEMAEGRLLARATRFVANTPTQRDQYLERFPRLRPERVVAIPNGFDEADFRVPARRSPPDRLTILHAGSFSDREGPSARRDRTAIRAWIEERLEYRNREYDLTAHSPRDVMAAVARLRSEEPGVYPTIRLDLAGEVGSGWRDHARELGIGDSVRFLGPRPHAEAVARMKGADLLLLTTDRRRDGGRLGRVSQKTYEYLRAGPPILYAGPEGDARDIVSRAGAGWCVEVGDRDAIVRAILDVDRAKRRGEGPGLRRDERFVARFERRRLTARLAEVFTAALRR
jgi:glycosyltransferase involved in cell wall biosynthesis